MLNAVRPSGAECSDEGLVVLEAQPGGVYGAPLKTVRHEATRSRAKKVNLKLWDAFFLESSLFRAGRTSNRNALFLYRVRPQIALLSEVGANGGERGLHHGRVEPCGRVTVLCFFQ